MGIWQDIRFGIRLLARNRAATAVSVLILAVGIGANTALFTVANAVLLRPVPGVAHPEEIVKLSRVQNGRQYSNSGYPDYVDYRDRAQSLSGLIAERSVPMSLAHGSTERIVGSIVTGNYFQVLGVKPALGRLLESADDGAPDANPVAVISDAFWDRMFARDRSAIGQKLMLNGYPFTILGVAAGEFQGTNTGERISVWVPMAMQREAMPRNANSNFLALRSAGWLGVYGRVRHGASLAQAQSEVASIAAGLQRAYPETNAGRSAILTRDFGLYPDQRQELRSLLGMLFAGVAMLLLIACVNVAGLFLTRAARRRREIAIRAAIGAGRRRLIRQLLAESFLVCFAAAALGLAIAPFTVNLALRLLGPADSAFRAPATIDGNVLLFTLGLSIAAGVLFGLAPAMQASRTDLVAGLKSSETYVAELRTGCAPRLATLLVIGQIAISAILLVGAGLLVRTMWRILFIDPGFRTDRVLMVAVDLAIQRYSEPQGKQFCERLAMRLAALPEVASVSMSKSEPARDWSDRRPVFRPEQEPTPEELRRNHDLGLLVDANTVSPGYFRTLGIPLAAGRDFTWQDREGAPGVAIVSESLARSLWPGQSAVGQRIAAPVWQEGRRPPLEVIGVARDARYRSLLADPPPLLYLPQMQHYDSYITIEVRTRQDPRAFAPRLRAEIAALDPNLPAYSLRTFSGQVAQSLWQQRSAATLIGVFGLIALALSALGLYSQLAHAVASRRRDIGIRMALGASPQEVRRSVLRSGLKLTISGAIVGLAGAAIVARFTAGLLYGVPPRDPLTFAFAAIILMAVALAASYLPARSATQVDPMQALRQD